MSPTTCILSSIFGLFWLFSALCAFSSKCLKPSKNCGFVALRAYLHCVFVGTWSNEKIWKKPTKNPPKMRSEPFKNRCQKRVAFQHRFFRVSASILQGLGLQDGAKLAKNRKFLKRGCTFFTFWSWRSWKIASWSAPDSILEPPGLDFGGSGLRFWPILKNSGIDFSAKSWLESVSYQQVRITWFRLKFMTVFHLACQQHEDKL